MFSTNLLKIVRKEKTSSLINAVLSAVIQASPAIERFMCVHTFCTSSYVEEKHDITETFHNNATAPHTVRWKLKSLCVNEFSTKVEFTVWLL